MNFNCSCTNTGPSARTRSLEIFRVWLVDVNFKVLHCCGRAKHSRSFPVHKQTNRVLLQDTRIRLQMLHEACKNYIRNSTQSISVHGPNRIRHAVVLSTHRSRWVILSSTLQGGGFPDVRSEGSVCVSVTGQRWWQRNRFDEVRDMTDCYSLAYYLRLK